ncbi:MAG: DNA polymerase I, partial [Candidatus Omnitrophota bacterium]
EVVIVSGDKDMIQLVDDAIKIFDYRSDGLIDGKKAQEKYGFAPSHIVDFLALAGDATDNIPGVQGIGKVTATDLVQSLGSLEDIYKHISKVKSEKVCQKLEEQKEQAMLSKELAILDDQVPVDFNMSEVKYRTPDNKQLLAFFEKLEFRKFAEDLGAGSGEEIICQETPLSSKKEVKDLCSKIAQKKEFAFFMPIEEEQDLTAKTQVAFSLDGKEVFLVALDMLCECKDIFESSDLTMICSNVKELFKVFGEKGLLIQNRIFDVMLAAYLLEPTQSAKDLGALCWKYFKISLSEESIAQKASALLKLYLSMGKELKEKSLDRLFYDIEIPLAYVLFCMESQGVAIDVAFLKELSQETNKAMELLTQKIYKIAGEEFNLNSPKQLGHVLFDKLKLPVVKKTKTGYSTDEDVLHRLALKHEMPQEILNYRQLAKITSTYIDALPKMVNAKTHRIHATFDQAGTETGRLSSRNPNLQNIPIRTEFGRQIRKAFIAKNKDSLLVSADYSQIELRILAHLSQDENLIAAFHKGVDVHALTAASIFDVDEARVTADMRVVAKRINFGIVYGMSAFGLAKDLEVSQKEAQEFIDKYFLRYVQVAKFMQEQIKKAEQDGFVITLLHRRRYMPEIHSENMALRQFAQRQAINTPVQGTAADLIKIAMIRVQKKIQELKLSSQMTITVHDELVFDVLRTEKDQLIAMIREEMEAPLSLSVPIKVAIKAGNNWLEMQEVKE